MSGRLLEIAIRPIRMAFLIDGGPSTRLLNRIFSANSGMWGGVHNLLCPTNGNLLTDEYLQLLHRVNPDLVMLCGEFSDRKAVLRQLRDSDIRPCFLMQGLPLAHSDSIGIGIEGILDLRMMQGLQRRQSKPTGIVDPRRGRPTLFDKAWFGIPPSRLMMYLEDRIDLVSLARFKRESQTSSSDYDDLIGMISITGENLDRYEPGGVRRFRGTPYRLGWPYFVVGTQDNLSDVCYFWNLRALSGPEMVRWVDRTNLRSYMTGLQNRIPPAAKRPLIMTCTGDHDRRAIEGAIKNLKTESVQFSDTETVFETAPAFVWKSETRREHTTMSEDEVVIPVRRPSSFELVYPSRVARWVMDVRILGDKALGTKGFVLPCHSYLAKMLTPAKEGRLRPRIAGGGFSFQVTSAPIDEHIRLQIPSDWEVIRRVFSEAGYDIDLSDQGRYMQRTLALFGGLPELSNMLRDSRVTAILSEFTRHHHSGEQLKPGGDYRRGLTLDDMRRVVTGLLNRKSSKKKTESYSFVDNLLKRLMDAGAVHSGYILDCGYCSLEGWYPINDVGESFRCQRCLASQTRPPSPSIVFRLHEALYQACLNNFVVPTLVLDTLNGSTWASFIFAPQIRLDTKDTHSAEIDTIAICDGILTIGEAKSTNSISKKEIGVLESTARRIHAQHFVLSTNSRQSCKGIDCSTCSQQEHYADNAFGHGSTSNWGTRERIIDLRDRLSPLGIRVTSICSEDISKREFGRNPPDLS